MILDDINTEVKLVSEWLQEPDPEYTWDIPGFFLENGFGLVSGQAKRGKKTFFTMLATCVLVTGRKYSYLAPEKPRSVWFIEEEGPVGATKQRLRNTFDTIGADWANLPAFAKENFKFSHRAGFKLDNRDHIRYMTKCIKEWKTEVVVLDTLSEMHTQDENSSQGMKRVGEGLKALRNETGCSIIMLYHHNKMEQTPKPGPPKDIDEVLRGSSVLSGLYDTHVGMQVRWPKGQPEPIRNDVWMTVRFRDGGDDTRYRILWDIGDLHAKGNIELDRGDDPREKSKNGLPNLAQEMHIRGYASGKYFPKPQLAETLGVPSGILTQMVAEGIQRGEIKLSGDGTCICLS